MTQVETCTHSRVDENHVCKQCEQYIMPAIEAGHDVDYYEPTMNASRKVIGFVLKVSNSRRSVTVYVPSTGKIMQLVRHLSDPKLNESDDHRENGAWDYSPRHWEVQALAQRIEVLEKALCKGKNNERTKEI
jgi:hypothetical protein